MDQDALKRESAAAFARVVSSVGTYTALAKKLGVTPGAVTQWQYVPIRHVATVEAITGIPREQLRPDFFKK